MKTIILVEPICRGSRLQILANTLSALKQEAHVVLVTRKDFQSKHFEELITSQGLAPEIVIADTDLGGAWMKNLNNAEFSLILDTVEKYLLSSPAKQQETSLVFMALDDYLISYATAARRIRNLKQHAEIFCMKYRVEYLFKLAPGFKTRSLVLKIVTQLALTVTGAKLICFDERLQKYENRYLAGTLPDPWFGEFSQDKRIEGRQGLGVVDADFLLLTLGKQDKRKGIDFLMSAFPLLADNTSYKLAVIGTISANFIDEFARFKSRFPKQVLHVNGFVDEADLPKYFAAADAFLLPYSSDFTATSGTLARASASGVQVLATDHGLVGHRVSTLGLGKTFKVMDTHSFKQAAQDIYEQRLQQPGDFHKRAAEFATSCTLNAFQNALKRILLN